jgi:hypothetical protein
MCYLYSTFGARIHASKSRRTWNSVKKPLPARVGGTGSSADLGGSSKYSNENFED